MKNLLTNIISKENPVNRFNRLTLIVASLFLFVGSAVYVEAQENQVAPGQWTQFRGTENGEAIASAKPPTKWDAQQTAWEVDIPGTGWSSPVYQEKRVWITSAVTTPMSEEEIAKRLAGDRFASLKTIAATVELHAICVDLQSGQLIHNFKLATIDNPEPINPLNSYASPTPAIADGKVICHFGSYGTWCLDEETGQQIWNKQFVVKHSVGPGSSPIVFDNKVIIVCDGTDLQYIVAVNLSDGEEIWKTSRPPIGAKNGEQRKAYSTPLVIDVEGKKQAVVPGAQWITSYDPATGKELWRVDHGTGFSVTPMAAFENDMVIFSTGYMEPEFLAIDPRGTGDVTGSHVIWRKKNAPAMPSFITESGQIFSISDKGIIYCFDAKTGEELNRGRIGGNFSASPLLAGGNLYLSSREGKMTIVKCSADLETIGTQDFGGSIMASPVLVGNDLLVRTEKKLIRIKSQ